MTGRRTAIALAVGVAVMAAVAGVWVGLSETPPGVAPAAAPPASAAAPAVDGTLGPRIKARLFYVAADGQHLTEVEQDVPYSNQTAAQARTILEAQFAPVTAPLVSAIPAGTRLRAVYLTPAGEAYVDLSAEVSHAHPGGLVSEMLTIYTVVNALAVNLPSVHDVQLLIDGKETDTLAGHFDLRRPLRKHLQLVVGR